MSRTNRLFLLLDALRGHRRPVTAAALAERLQVSERTIYRDIATLAGLGAPVEGEAGVGFMMRAGLFLPPLMFSPDELEALVLGARWVRRQGDPGLAGAASSALAKIATATPQDLRDSMADTSLWVPATPDVRDVREVREVRDQSAGPTAPADNAFIQSAREAIRREHKLHIGYRDESGAATDRTVWPFALAFFEGRRLLAAWCELRGAIRHFRVDRIASLRASEERYATRRRQLLIRWRAEQNIPEDS